jgi:hypothetical protein
MRFSSPNPSNIMSLLVVNQEKLLFVFILLSMLLVDSLNYQRENGSESPVVAALDAVL